MDFEEVTAPIQASRLIYIHSIKRASSTVKIIELALRGYTILEIATELKLPFTHVNNTRWRFSTLINLYIKHGVLLFPEQ